MTDRQVRVRGVARHARGRTRTDSIGAVQAWLVELLPDVLADRAMAWRFDWGTPSAAHEGGPVRAYLDSRRLSESVTSSVSVSS